MTRPYYEIVTYRVSDPASADKARADATALLRSYPSFIAWTAFCGADQPDMRVDLLTWGSLAEARSAAKAVGDDPNFGEFRASVASLISMEHYVVPVAEPQPVGPECGVELGRFRLKDGVSEDDMRMAYQTMIESHLARQPGWRRQHLVKLDDGVFIDLAFAGRRAQSEAICGSWQGQTDCEAFLSMIEPETIEFGSLI